MENKIEQFLKQHKTGTISKGVHEYNDIRAALVASGVNETKQAKHKNTIYHHGYHPFSFSYFLYGFFVKMVSLSYCFCGVDKSFNWLQK